MSKLKWHFDNNAPLSTNICLLFTLCNYHNLCIFLICSGGSAKMTAEGQTSQGLRNCICFPLHEQQFLQFSSLWQYAFLGSISTPPPQDPKHWGPDPVLLSAQVQQWKTLRTVLSLSLGQGNLWAAMVNKPGGAPAILAVGECVYACVTQLIWW